MIGRLALDAARAASGPPPRTKPGSTIALQGNVVPAACTRTRRPQAPPIDGQLLWNLTRRYLCHYVAFASEAQANLVTGWVFHVMTRERDDTGMGPLIWRATPRLLVTSSKRRSGKSTLLDLLAILTGSRRGKMPKVTPARIAQVLSKYHETAFIDEAKTIFGAGAGHIELQGCLLAGYTRKSSYEVSGHSLSLFGPVALAAKENLITDTRTDTMGDLMDRCLKIVLDSPPYPMPEVGERAEEDGELLCRALVAWTDSVRADLKKAAADIADEDYAEAQQLVKDDPRAAAEMNWRLAQIGRPLRACGRVAGPMHVTEKDGTVRGPLDGAEKDILDALEELTAGTASAEAHEALAELERRAEKWGSPLEDEDGEMPAGGRVVFGGDDETGLADLAASLPAEQPAPAPVRQSTITQRPSRPAARLWAAVKVTPGDGGQMTQAILGDRLDGMNEAAEACAGDAGTALSWAAGATPGVWLAVAGDITYAISAGK